MGDKVSAKQAMIKSGVPCVPGSEGALPDDPKEIIRIARAAVGYPVIIKAAGGGGGRGMRVVHTEAACSMPCRPRGRGRCRLRQPGRLHGEVPREPAPCRDPGAGRQHRNAVWLGERDCSMQRRHQKIIEEAPAPGIPRR
jgi:acetyl-CoA carboxylase biotin carboxylase subunit